MLCSCTHTATVGVKWLSYSTVKYVTVCRPAGGAGPAGDEVDSSCSRPSPTSSDDVRTDPAGPRHRGQRSTSTAAAVPDGLQRQAGPS